MLTRAHHVQRAADALLLVAVRRVDEDGQAVVDGDLDLDLEVLLFLGGHVIVADLADRDDALPGAVLAHELDGAVVDAVVVGLLWG
ncbi:MAG: hypothetical protein R3F60_05155 [bacterium]